MAIPAIPAFPENYIPPKVFISYSWTNDDYAEWVKALADRLARNSIDVILDRWDLQAGQDKYAFMEKMVTDPAISKVLVLCDQRYCERADRREGGVGTESTIISQEVYNQVDQQKFIPIVTEKGPDREVYLPTFIKSRIYIDLSDEKLFERGYEELLRNLTGRPASQRPPLGPPPAFLFEKSRPTSPTTYALRPFENAITNGRPQATGLAREYLDRLVDVLTGFEINVDTVKDTEQRQLLMLQRLKEWDPLRDEWVDFLRIICRYGTDPRLFEAVPAFFESFLKLTRSMHQNRWTQHLSFMAHEAFLYAATVSLQEQRFELAALLLNNYYRDPAVQGSGQRFGVFCDDTRFMEQLLNEKWKREGGGHGYKYPQHQWIYTRSKDDLVPFELLKETDLIIWLRYRLEADPDQYLGISRWFPVTVGSLEEYHWRVQHFPLFQLAASRRVFEQVKAVLGVESKEDFLERFNRSFKKKLSQNTEEDDYWRRVFSVDTLASTL